MKPKIALIVTGSVAVCKIPQFLEKMSVAWSIDLVLTKAPEQWQHKPRWIPIEKLRRATTGSVFTDGDFLEAKKKSLQEAAIILVAPATADFISQLAGRSSDLARLVLDAHALGALLYIAPAMNYKIWEHPAVQRNCAKLADRGVCILGPVEGAMACNDFGFGRMMDVDEIAARIQAGGAASDSYAAARQAAENTRTEYGTNEHSLLVVLAGDNMDWAEIAAFFSDIEKEGIPVKVVLDQNGRKFAEPLGKLLAETVITDHYQVDSEGLEHIRLPQQCCGVVFPFVNESLARQMIAGSSRSLGMDIYLASKAPVAIIPSKKAPLEKETLSALRQDGMQIFENAKDLRLLGTERQKHIL